MQEHAPTTAQAYSTHGLLYYQLGKWAQAIASYQHALNAFQATDDFFGMGQISCQLADVMLQQQQYESARQWAAIAVRFFAEVNRRRPCNYSLLRSHSAVALYHLGKANFHQGQYALALRQLEKALSIRCELQDEVGEAIALVAVGKAYTARKQLWYALACYEAALEISQFKRSIFDGNWFEVEVRCLIADLCESCGHWDLALKHYSEALALRHPEKAGVEE